MKRILLFAGATEGRELAEFLAGLPVEVTVSTATEYGAALLPHGERVTCLSGRLDESEMEQLLLEGAFSWVVDATHPYAQQAGENIRRACEATKTSFLRLSRSLEQSVEGVLTVPDAQGAAQLLDEMEGKALLTTGSKELAVFTQVRDFPQRLYPRVLPLPQVLESCIELGYLPAHIIAMQGPFSREFNLALLRQTGCTILVTKNTGGPGGFAEKLSAAREAGAQVIVIAPPKGREGMTLPEMQSFFQRELRKGNP